MKNFISENWIGLLAMSCLIGLTFVDPIQQDSSYHNFADHCTHWGIPNFHNVVSNLPFLGIGIFGLLQLLNIKIKRSPYEKHVCMTTFLGMVLLFFGSSFYHLSPTNFGLLLDRIPMTIIFISFFSYILYKLEFIRTGKVLFYAGIPLGIFSAIYWYYSESLGCGDLRFYAFIQFFPILVLPIILVVKNKKNRQLKTLIAIFAFYVGAKLLEHYDYEINNLIHFSGHALKHWASSIAMYFIYRYFGSHVKVMRKAKIKFVGNKIL
jgi:hypothetical protein